MKKSKRPTIFISYAREDAAAARKLHAELKKSGAAPWLDDDMSPGLDWKREITKRIQQSDFFVALLSQRSVSKRGYVQKELKEALAVLEEMPDGRIYVIPVRLEECAPSHFRLKELNWVDLFPSWHKGVERILIALEIDTFRKAGKKFRTSKPPRRLALTISPESMHELDKLKDELGASSTTDVIRHALALLSWSVEEMKSGNRVMVDRDGKQIEVVLGSSISARESAA